MYFFSHSLFLAPTMVPFSSSTTSRFTPSRSVTTAMLPVSAPISSVALESTLVRNGCRLSVLSFNSSVISDSTRISRCSPPTSLITRSTISAWVWSSPISKSVKRYRSREK